MRQEILTQLTNETTGDSLALNDETIARVVAYVEDITKCKVTQVIKHRATVHLQDLTVFPDSDYTHQVTADVVIDSSNMPKVLSAVRASLNAYGEAWRGVYAIDLDGKRRVAIDQDRYDPTGMITVSVMQWYDM